jgi:hypothetical protein
MKRSLAVCALLGLMLLSFASCKNEPVNVGTLDNSATEKLGTSLSVTTTPISSEPTIAETTAQQSTVPNTTRQAVATTRKPATTVPATTVPKAIGGLVNTTPGEIEDEELRAFFKANRALLESIAAQMIPLQHSIDLYTILKTNSSIEAYDSDGDAIDIAHLKASLRQQLEQYFNAAGNANRPSVSTQKTLDQYITVDFVFILGQSNGHRKSIRYSPERQEDYWPVLDDNWYIYEFYGI